MGGGVSLQHVFFHGHQVVSNPFVNLCHQRREREVEYSSYATFRQKPCHAPLLRQHAHHAAMLQAVTGRAHVLPRSSCSYFLWKMPVGFYAIIADSFSLNVAPFVSGGKM